MGLRIRPLSTSGEAGGEEVPAQLGTSNAEKHKHFDKGKRLSVKGTQGYPEQSRESGIDRSSTTHGDPAGNRHRCSAPIHSD